MTYISLAEVRNKWQAFVNMVMNFCFPQNARNFLTSWRAVSFSGRSVFHGVGLSVCWFVN